MSITILPKEITDEKIYPIKNPNPADTVDTIIAGLKEIENSIDSPEVNSEVIEMSSGGMIFGRSSRTILNIKLRETKTPEIKKMGVAIVPAQCGNLVYLVQYEYIDAGWGFFSRDELIANAKKKLNTIDKWMEYTFIQTMGDYVYIELLKKYDPDFESNLAAYRTYITRQ